VGGMTKSQEEMIHLKFQLSTLNENSIHLLLRNSAQYCDLDANKIEFNT